MDYDSLVTTIEARMNRTDHSDKIPDFVRHVEEEANARLARDPVRPMVKTYTLSASTQRVDLPDDFIDVIDLTLNDGTSTWPLARLEPGRQFDFYKKALPPGIEYDSDDIQHFRIMGDTIVLSATPSSAVTLTLDCYTKLEAVNEANATNWLMDNHSDVYVFGTLAHYGHFVRDYEFYRDNKALFADMLEVVVGSYPERKREIGRSDPDAPWAYARWNINSG